jgi:hypothetical protein
MNPHQSSATDTRADLINSVWADIQSSLERRKRHLHEEIRTYPPPIPACDRQFDYLLEQRANLLAELDRLCVVREDSSSRDDSLDAIDQFLTASRCLGKEEEQRIRSHLNAERIKHET